MVRAGVCGGRQITSSGTQHQLSGVCMVPVDEDLDLDAVMEASGREAAAAMLALRPEKTQHAKRVSW